MSQFKKVNVVMLPTNQKAPINKTGDLLTIYSNEGDKENYQHLYFLSDDTIKKGDYFLNYNSGKIDYNTYSGHAAPKLPHRKIIATTNSSLKYDDSNVEIDEKGRYSVHWSSYPLPAPSTSFVEKYVSKFNEGKPIKSVKVEYFKKYNTNDSYELEVKTNLGNTIIIKKEKTTWTREEVVELIDNLLSHPYKVIDAIKEQRVKSDGEALLNLAEYGPYSSLKTFKSTESLIDEKNSFLSTIPNHLGINLTSVKGIEYNRQEDGQLLSLTIQFTPETPLTKFQEVEKNRENLLKDAEFLFGKDSEHYKALEVGTLNLLYSAQTT